MTNLDLCTHCARSVPNYILVDCSTIRVNYTVAVTQTLPPDLETTALVTSHSSSSSSLSSSATRESMMSSIASANVASDVTNSSDIASMLSTSQSLFALLPWLPYVIAAGALVVILLVVVIACVVHRRAKARRETAMMAALEHDDRFLSATYDVMPATHEADMPEPRVRSMQYGSVPVSQQTYALAPAASTGTRSLCVCVCVCFLA
jgi:hypothetical protein